MWPYVAVLMCVGIGGLFAYLGWGLVVSRRRKLATWLRAQGAVVDLKEETASEGRTVYAPVYRYTADGSEHTGLYLLWLVLLGETR